MKIVKEEELNNWLQNHPQWRYEEPEIFFEKGFQDFSAALLMEQHNHHATIQNTYNHVRLSLITHDAGNKITDKDLKLAEAIEELR